MRTLTIIESIPGVLEVYPSDGPPKKFSDDFPALVEFLGQVFRKEHVYMTPEEVEQAVDDLFEDKVTELRDKAKKKLREEWTKRHAKTPERAGGMAIV